MSKRFFDPRAFVVVLCLSLPLLALSADSKTGKQDAAAKKQDAKAAATSAPAARAETTPIALMPTLYGVARHK